MPTLHHFKKPFSIYCFIAAAIADKDLTIRVGSHATRKDLNIDIQVSLSPPMDFEHV